MVDADEKRLRGCCAIAGKVTAQQANAINALRRLKPAKTFEKEVIPLHSPRAIVPDTALSLSVGRECTGTLWRSAYEVGSVVV